MKVGAARSKLRARLIVLADGLLWMINPGCGRKWSLSRIATG